MDRWLLSPPLPQSMIGSDLWPESEFAARTIEAVHGTNREKMKQERKENARLPVACTLTPAELTAMRTGLLPGLLARSSAKAPIPGGFRWRFDPQANLVQEAAAVIEAEHRCCRFLRFVLLVEPGDGPVWLEVTGPEGTESFLDTLLDTTPLGR